MDKKKEGMHQSFYEGCSQWNTFRDCSGWGSTSHSNSPHRHRQPKDLLPQLLAGCYWYLSSTLASAHLSDV